MKDEIMGLDQVTDAGSALYFVCEQTLVDVKKDLWNCPLQKAARNACLMTAVHGPKLIHFQHRDKCPLTKEVFWTFQGAVDLWVDKMMWNQERASARKSDPFFSTSREKWVVLLNNQVFFFDENEEAEEFLKKKETRS